MLKLRKAYLESEWSVASEILKKVTARLHDIGYPLWSEPQVSAKELKSSYKIDELHFILDFSDNIIGLVFLQDSDPYFWPEIHQADSLFVHKLAIDPVYQGNGYGRNSIQLIAIEAKKRNFQWVRLDCDDRKPLHAFYQDNGFKLVDIKRMQQFVVARYELLITR